MDAILAHTHRNLLTGGDEALLRLGTQEALRAIAEGFTGCDRDLEAAEKELADWKAATAPGSTTAGLALAMAQVELLKVSSDLVRLSLATLLAERGLTPPEPRASSEVWRAWIEQNLPAFPEHLPGLSSPAW